MVAARKVASHDVQTGLGVQREPGGIAMSQCLLTAHLRRPRAGSKR